MTFILVITSVLLLANFPLSASFPVNQTSVSGTQDNPLSEDLNRTESLVVPDETEKTEKVSQLNDEVNTKKSNEAISENSNDGEGKLSQNTPVTGLNKTDSYAVSISPSSQETPYDIVDNDHQNILNKTDISDRNDWLPLNLTEDESPSMTLPRAYHDLMYNNGYVSNETQSTFTHNKTLEDIINREYNNETNEDSSSDNDSGYIFYDYRSPVDENNDFYDSLNSVNEGDVSLNLKPTKDIGLVGNESSISSEKDVSNGDSLFFTTSPESDKTPSQRSVVNASTFTKPTELSTTSVLLSTKFETSTASSTATMPTKLYPDMSKTLPTKIQLKPTPLLSSTAGTLAPSVSTTDFRKFNISGTSSTVNSLQEDTRTVTIHASPTKLATKKVTIKEQVADTPTPPTPPSVDTNSSPPTPPLPPTAPSVTTQSIAAPTPPPGVGSSSIVTQSMSSTESPAGMAPTPPIASLSTTTTILPPIPGTESTSAIPPTPPVDLSSTSGTPSALPPTPPHLSPSSTLSHVQNPTTQSVASTQSSTYITTTSSSETIPTQSIIPKTPLSKPISITISSSVSISSTTNSPTTTITKAVLPPAPVTEETKLATLPPSSSSSSKAHTTIQTLPSTSASSASQSSETTKFMPSTLIASSSSASQTSKFTKIITPTLFIPISSKPQSSKANKDSLTTTPFTVASSTSHSSQITKVIPTTLFTSRNPLSAITSITSRITPIIDLPKTLPSKTKPYDESGKLTSYTSGGKPFVPTEKVQTSLPTTTTTVRRSETKHHENAIIPVTDFPKTTTPVRHIITKPGPPDSEINIINPPTENHLPTPTHEPVPTKRPPVPNEVTDDTLPELYLIFHLRMAWPEFCGHRVQFKTFLLQLLQQDKQQQHQPFLSEIDFTYQIVFPGSSEKCKTSKPRLKRGTDYIKVFVYVADYKGRYDKFMTEKLYSLVTTMDHNGVFIFDGQVENVKLQGMKPHTTVTEPVPKEKPQLGPGIIIGICLGSLTFIFIALFITLKAIAIKKRSRVKQMRYCENHSGVRTPDETSSLAESIQLSGVHGRERFAYCNPNLIMNSLNTTNPSNILNKAGLTQMIFDDELVDEEFMLLPNTMPKLSEVPIGAEDKNRFANVIPARPTRVYLNYIRGEEHSDYFNANFVRGFDGNPKFYIATQAPLEGTRSDFWRMIWEQRCQVILMLTQLDENGLSKCAEYWPNTDHADKVRIYTDYEVILQRRQVKPYWIISTLILKELERNLCREVHHIWFLVWPEQDLPPSPVVLSFLSEVWDYTHDSDSPVVVHCCPGTGRTGTLIAIDTCMRQYMHSKMVDILQCVYNLRHDRAGAVQTKQQYAFIYETLHDFSEYRSRTPSRASSVASGIHY